MDTTQDRTTTSGRPGRPAPAHDYRRLAPSVAPDWVEAFVLEQRLRGVPGDRIGDALALVESHVAESGEGAQEAFGDPADYAREATPSARTDDLDGSWFVGNGLGLVGMLLTATGFSSWLAGERVAVTVGSLVLVGLVAAAFLTLHLAAEPFLRLVVHRPVTATGLFVLHFALIVGALVLFQAPVAQLSAVVTMGLGVAALALGTLLEWRSSTGGDLEDPIVGPGERPAPGRRGPFALVTLLIFPLLTIGMLALAWLLHVLS